MKVLVTGAAGFIGFHTAKALLGRGDTVVGLDSLNSYYDVKLKQARLERLTGTAGFRFLKADLADRSTIADIFADTQPNRVVHLGAQAGVRYGLEDPLSYVQSNLVGFLNVLEGCRHNGIEHLVYASSSSVYGANTSMPYAVSQNVDHPLSFYGATKKANELMAHTYAHIFGLPVTGLRFFTVYGPWGRPDMALFTFTRQMLAGEPIDVFNYGDHARDFTYIDDVMEGVVRVLDRVAAPNPAWRGAEPDPASSSAPYRLYNIGNTRPVELMDLIACLEQTLGKTAIKNFVAGVPGDMLRTWADVSALIEDVEYRPTTPLEEGVRRFVEWYKDYYGVGIHKPA